MMCRLKAKIKTSFVFRRFFYTKTDIVLPVGVVWKSKASDINFIIVTGMSAFDIKKSLKRDMKKGLIKK